MKLDELLAEEIKTEHGNLIVPVSVVIPMFNAGKTITDALLSVNKQSYLPQEVVIIDDGSSDNSLNVVNAFIQARKFDFKCIVKTQSNAGPASARNKGVQSATKPLIAFLDADDEWLPTKIEKQYQLYLSLLVKGIDVGIIDCYQMDKNIITNVDHLADKHKKGNHFKDFYRLNMVNGTSCVLIARQHLLECGGFDESLHYSEDRWLWSNICHQHEIHTVGELLCIRYIGDSNIVSNPTKYFKYKKEFVVKFLEKYGPTMNKSEKMDFFFTSYYEFFRAFYLSGHYTEATQVFSDMFKFNYRVIFYKKGLTSLRALNAWYKKHFN